MGKEFKQETDCLQFEAKKWWKQRLDFNLRKQLKQRIDWLHSKAKELLKQRLDFPFEKRIQTTDRMATLTGEKTIETTVRF